MPNCRKRAGWIVLAALIVPLRLWAQPPVEEPAPPVEEPPPISIKAETLNADEHRALFSGHVVVVRGDATLTCDSLTATYVAASQELEKIEAEGHVVIVQADRRATGDKAVYTRAEDRAVLTGNPVLEQGENRFKGKRITVYFQQKLFKGEDVELIFTPDTVKGDLPEFVQPKEPPEKKPPPEDQPGDEEP